MHERAYFEVHSCSIEASEPIKYVKNEWKEIQKANIIMSFLTLCANMDLSQVGLQLCLYLVFHSAHVSICKHWLWFDNCLL